MCFCLSITYTFGQSFGAGNQGGPPPNRQMGQRPPQRPDNMSSDQLVLEKFPEIPNITLEQRQKIGSILTDEHKNITKQFEKKRDIEIKSSKSNMTPNEFEKQRKKLDKIDKKISDIQTKSNKKVRKILSDEQYKAFIEKRNSFKFKNMHQGPPDFNKNDDKGHRPPQRQ